MDISKITALLEQRGKEIEIYTKEFQALTTNPQTPNSFNLQTKWSVVFNTLKEIVSEYKGVVHSMKALGIPISQDDEQLLTAHRRGIDINEKDEIVYDEEIIAQAIDLMQNSGVGASSNGVAKKNGKDNSNGFAKADDGSVIPPQ